MMGYKSLLTCLPPAVRWGRDNEPIAREAYITYMAAKGSSLTVSESGLHLHQEPSYLGASSDGRVVDHSLDDSCGCLEIKCPFSVGGQSVVHMTPLEIAQTFPSYSCLQVGPEGQLSLREAMHITIK